MSVLVLLPNGSGGAGFAMHTRNTGATNFGCCNENPHNSDTTYVSNTSDGTGFDRTIVDAYAHTNSTGQVGTITNVRVVVTARYSLLDASGLAKVAPLIRINAVGYIGTAQNVTGSYAEYAFDWATNPNTSAAWTWVNIDGIIAGVQSTTKDGGSGGTTVVRITQIRVEVTHNRVFQPTVTATATAGVVTPDFVDHAIFEPIVIPTATASVVQPDFVHPGLSSVPLCPPLVESAEPMVSAVVPSDGLSVALREGLVVQLAEPLNEVVFKEGFLVVSAEPDFKTEFCR